MPIRDALIAGLRLSTIEVIDLTAPLNADTPVTGFGVETTGTDAGTAHSFDPPFPCHAALPGAGKYGLTQPRNLARLPATGAVLIAGPLPITGGSGSPCRAIALAEHA